MGHKQNIEFLNRLYKQEESLPGAGSIKNVIHDYKQLLSNRLEAAFLEKCDGHVSISMLNGGVIKGRIKELGTYTLIVEFDEGAEHLVYKSSIIAISKSKS